MASNTDPAVGSPISEKKKTMSFGQLMHVYDHDDEGTGAISKDTVQTVLASVQSNFPTAMSGHVFCFQLADILSHAGFTNHNVLLGTSFCGDDVNRDFENELMSKFGDNTQHTFGGLAGYCFSGTSAMADLLHHIPQNGGHAVLVFGPHVGIDYDGVVGKVNRRGHNSGSGSCCATAAAAAMYAKMVKSGERQPHKTCVSADGSDDVDDLILDIQHKYVENQVLKYVDRLEAAADEAIELPNILYDSQNELMNKLLAKTLSQLPSSNTKIAVIGGIQVNTPDGTGEYFVPKRFDLIDSTGKVIEDMLQELHTHTSAQTVATANTPGW